MDCIFTNGHFYDEQDLLRDVSAVLARDGRVVRVARNTDELGLSADELENAETVDLQGAWVYPGFADTHLHILNAALTAHMLPLEKAKSKDELLSMIAGAAKDLPEGSWIEGRGFNQDLWPEAVLPDRRELDAAAPLHPVRVTRVCGHMMIANSAAFEKQGLHPGMPLPEGGTVDFDKGIITENALFLMSAGGGDPGVEHCKQMLTEGLNMAADHGLTYLYSDDLTAGDYAKETVMEAYRQLSAEGKMPVRVVEQCALATDEELDAFVKNGHTYLSGNSFFRVGPRKLYADGSLGAGTAWLCEPYADGEGKGENGCGVPTCTREGLSAMFVHAHRTGFPCIVHAIGDAAAECVLDAAEYAMSAATEGSVPADGIVHCQITSERTLRRIRELNMRVYAQPVFAEYDLHICRRRVGEKRESTSYNWKTLLESGVCVSSGSDCPVESLDPAGNIYCAVTRKDYTGFPESGWMPEQRLSVRQAIACHTSLAAKAMGFEQERGRIAPGCLADFTVYPCSLEAVPPEEILRFRPLMTVLGGKARLCGKG